jgi:hypothetical protein
MVTVATWVLITGMVCLSLEGFEVAMMFFGIAVFLFAHG